MVGGVRVMPDREKVLRGWERCKTCNMSIIESNDSYRDCEYTIGLYCEKDKLINETIELLKEQEETINELQKAYGYLQKQFFEAHDKLLKQEAVVRCKDCIYKEVHPSPYRKYWCNRLKCGCDDDWFCAYGKRREEE